MKFSALFTLSLFLAVSTASIATQTVTVILTEDVSQATAAAQDTTSIIKHAVSTPTAATATTTSAPATTTAAASTDSDSGQYVDTDAGASGSTGDNSFNLSKGGLIAIIVVVVLVVVFGVASTVLFVLAKRRQWNVRASIARVSRRLTGRFGGGKADNLSQRRDRRTGVYAGGARKISPPRVVAIKPPGHTRGLVVNVQDVEKGPSQSVRPVESDSTRTTWTNKFFAKR